MKTLACLAVLVVVTNATDPEFMKQIKMKMLQQMTTCAKEVSATATDLEDIGAHKMPSTHEGKCIFFCMHKIYSVQNDDGSLNMPAALANLDMIKDMDLDLYNKAYATFTKCESTPSDPDPCIFASKLVECVVKEAIAMGMDCPVFA